MFMSDDEYERTIKELEQHVHRQPDGTFKVDHDGTGFNPDIFSDLTKSVEVTNRLIREGVIRAEDIEC